MATRPPSPRPKVYSHHGSPRRDAEGRALRADHEELPGGRLRIRAKRALVGDERVEDVVAEALNPPSSSGTAEGEIV